MVFLANQLLNWNQKWESIQKMTLYNGESGQRGLMEKNSTATVGGTWPLTASKNITNYTFSTETV